MRQRRRKLFSSIHPTMSDEFGDNINISDERDGGVLQHLTAKIIHYTLYIIH